jgi:hypothetical protein
MNTQALLLGAWYEDFLILYEPGRLGVLSPAAGCDDELNYRPILKYRAIRRVEASLIQEVGEMQY